MKDQIQFETNGLRVLAFPAPNWYCNCFVSMGYVVIKCQNEKAFIAESDFFHPDKLDKAMEKASKLPEYVEKAEQLPDVCEWKFFGVTTEITDNIAHHFCKRNLFYQSNGYPVFKYYGANRETFASSVMAMSSTLRSHGIDPAEKWVILIEQKA